MKRQRRSKREIERYYFEMFRKAYSSPEGTVRYGDKPDVIIEGPRKIGIEMTNFYREDGSADSSEQVQERRRVKVVGAAQRAYEEASGKRCQLTFSFNKDEPILDAEDLIRRLVAFAGRIEGEENRSISRNQYRDIPEVDFVDRLARELVYPEPYEDSEFPDGEPDSSVNFEEWARYWNHRDWAAKRAGIYRPLTEPAKWTVAQAHEFGPMSLDRLAAIVSEKEQKVGEYESCECYWLLVVVDFLNPAQEQEIRLDNPLPIDSAVFEKIIVYKTHLNQIVETG
jgi:hypothetical protein